VRRTATAAPALVELHVRILLVTGDFAGCLKLLPSPSPSSSSSSSSAVSSSAVSAAAAASPPMWADWAAARAAYGQGEAERARALLQALVGRALAEAPVGEEDARASGGGEAAAARTAAAARALLSTVTQQLAHKTAGNAAFKTGRFSQVGGCVRVCVREGARIIVSRRVYPPLWGSPRRCCRLGRISARV